MTSLDNLREMTWDELEEQLDQSLAYTGEYLENVVDWVGSDTQKAFESCIELVNYANRLYSTLAFMRANYERYHPKT